MDRKVTIIIALQAFLIIILFWMLVFYGRDEYEAFVQGEIEEEIETPDRVSYERGITFVTLEEPAQEQSGIATIKLEAAQYSSALSTYGSVVSIDGLLEQRSRYLSAQAEADMARAALANSQQEFQRLSVLNKEDRNVSDRAVSVAEAQMKSDQARVRAAESMLRSLRDNMRQQWGESLTAQAVQTAPNTAISRILQHEDVLIQVTLPFGMSAPGVGSSVQVIPPGNTDGAVSAQFVSVSPKADTAIQGETYYYRAPAANLRVGMRVSVSLNDRESAQTGVIVPRNAIVWYGGQAWCYRKSGDDRFSRVYVSTDQEVDGGWFNIGRLLPGDEIVVTGAQLLLSEEFKYQITNENDD
ncbi:MAG TPA: hypothetical protein VIK69_09820 [Methylophilaceae bacterium]